jgi:ABC-2 type transport system ATP-binding protein
MAREKRRRIVWVAPEPGIACPMPPSPSSATSSSTPSDLPPVIEARRLSKLFDRDVGVRDLDLTVQPGTIIGLIGPSGSGKTTAVRLLAGLLAPAVGEVRVLGERPVDFSPSVHADIGYLPQTSVMYPNLTIAENLDFASAIYGIPAKERAERRRRMLESLELGDAADRRLADSSGGMARRLGLAVAMIHDPQLMFLDEPTAGLDPILRQALWDRFAELRDSGRTLVITTQYVGEAAFCDEIIVLSEGSVVARGEPESLRRGAFDGELVEVVFVSPPNKTDLEAFARNLASHAVERVDAVTVRLTVDDAGRVLPRISEIATSCGLAINETSEVVPTFDDVFVRLIDRHRAAV